MIFSLPIFAIGIPLDEYRTADNNGVMNWTKILADIFAAGQTQMAVAEHCGCGQSTISELARGVTTKPSFDLGQKLIELHKNSTQQG